MTSGTGPGFDCYEQRTLGLSAEVFELDLGEKPLERILPLHFEVTKGTAHWRLVIFFTQLDLSPQQI